MHEPKQGTLDIQEFAKYCATVMSITEQNFEKISNLSSFLKICEILFGIFPKNFEEIKTFQEAILSHSKRLNSFEFNAYIHEAFDILEKNRILEKSSHANLKEQFFIKKEENKPLNVTKFDENFTFNQKIGALFEIIDELKNYTESNTLQNKISKSKEALKNRKFSIGITGVMNAGKSTLLNALMKSNLLGTAVVPETANLSIIKFSKKKFANVNFWSKKEWDDIVKSADSIPQMGDFVKETSEAFGENLNEFIKEVSLQQKIKLEELTNYTSAIASNKKCNLVKSVELHIDLPFLEDGVVIVDTPGLDDPVIQREEITKKYLSECDLMMHLMNVSQSATAKDIEFIIDTLTYQGVSRLLIVLTRIDTVSNKELEEVKEYTKKSIKSQLEKQNKGALFNSIIDKLEFIEVSGKFALMHRTGQKEKALKLGFDEEKTGIIKIEKYLEETLFGANSPKATLLLNSNAKILYTCAEESINFYENEKENLNKSAGELKVQLSKKEQENSRQKEHIDKTLLSTEEIKKGLEVYAKTLLLEVGQRTNSLKNKIFHRVYDDVKYELSKNKKKPTNERITYFIDSGIKDGLLDVIRDFRFSFSKKSDESYEKIVSLIDENSLSQAENLFDVKSFFELHKNSVNSNFSALINDVLLAIKKVSKSNLDEFGNMLDGLLFSEFKKITNELEEVLKSLSSLLIEEFEKSIKEPLELKKAVLNEEVESLKKQIDLIEKNVEEAKLRAEALKNKISALKNLQNRLKYFLFE